MNSPSAAAREAATPAEIIRDAWDAYERDVKTHGVNNVNRDFFIYGAAEHIDAFAAARSAACVGCKQPVTVTALNGVRCDNCAAALRAPDGEVTP